jgi:hypothetical protein
MFSTCDHVGFAVKAVSSQDRRVRDVLTEILILTLPGREEGTVKGEGMETDIPISYSISSEHIDH